MKKRESSFDKAFLFKKRLLTNLFLKVSVMSILALTLISRR